MPPKLDSYTRVPNNGLFEPVVYKNVHVYIVDDVDPGAEGLQVMGMEKRDPHAFKCNVVRKFFKKYSDFEVHSVRFKKWSKLKHVADYWKEELKDKTSEDLLIVFFHGQAGGMDSEYKW